MQRFKDSIDFVSLLDLADPFLNSQTSQLNEAELSNETNELKEPPASNIEDKKELEQYEKSWSESQKTEPVEEEEEKPEKEVVLEKSVHSIVPVAEAIKEPRRRKSRRGGPKRSKASKLDSEHADRKLVKERVNCKSSNNNLD